MQNLWHTLRARRSIHGRVGVWYHPEYAAPALKASARVANIEPRRGELILARAIEDGWLRPADVRRAPMASVEQLQRFHSWKYMTESTQAPLLGRIFGLEEDDVPVEQLVGATRRAVGGTISAATEAAAMRMDVAFNLGGGFHHAEPEQGSGFCIYNDIGVSISDLRRRGYKGRIAIVDLDFHQGNGNTVAYANDSSVHVYSIHGAVWSHSQVPRFTEIHLSGAVDSRRYLASLRTTLETSLRRFKPSLVFYIAGADVLAGDRLGAYWMTLRGMFQRDRHVVEVVDSLDVPLVITLGGGYSDRAWMGHFNLLRHVLTGSVRVSEPDYPNLSRTFAKVARHLDPYELQQYDDDEIDITEEDLMMGLGSSPQALRLLNFYTRHGVEVALERYGILEKVRKRGYQFFDVEIDPKDPARQVVKVFGKRDERDYPHLLVELVLRRQWISSPLPEQERLEVLTIEWLLLQDPLRNFTLDRPPLPGQDHPGLGIAMDIQELLVRSCLRLRLHGLLDRPAHFHNAAGVAHRCHFLDARAEGRFRALLKLAKNEGIVEVSEAIDQGRLKTKAGETIPWEAVDHLLPVSDELKEYFNSNSYRNAQKIARNELLEAEPYIVEAPPAAPCLS